MLPLPQSFRLNDLGASLPPSATSKVIACRPTTGQTWGAQSIIDVDLPATGWLDPSSLTIRYKVAYTGGPLTTSGTIVVGVPVYAPFQRLQITQGGSVIDSIGSYSQVAYVLTNLGLGISNKAGQMTGYGYNPFSTGNFTFLDGRLLGNSATPTANLVETLYLSAPLHCILNQSKKNIPLFASDPIRLTFTLDSLKNMSWSGGGIPAQELANMVISNFEVVATIYDLGKDVERATMAQGPLFLKSASFNNSSLLVNSGTSGSNSYFFNQRLSSIRSLFLLPAQLVGSKGCEICDITSGAGDYSFQINAQQFPPLPLSSVLNDGGILSQIFKAANTIYPNTSMSIDQTEFNAMINTVPTLYNSPGKFLPSLSLMKCGLNDDIMMSGTSSKDTGINAIINIPTATTAACMLGLLLYYDVVLVFDPFSKKISVRN